MLRKVDVDGFLVKLEAMLKSGMTLKDSLVFLRRMPATQKMARDSLWAMEEGRTFSDGIRKYVSPAEYALLLSGEKSDSLVFAIQKALYLRRVQRKIKGVFVGAMIYPAMVFAMVVLGVYYIGNNIIPQLEDAGLKATGVLKFYKAISDPAVLFSVAGFILFSFIGTIVFSTKFLGPYRRFTDRFFPFQVYRKWMGVIFLYMVSSMTKSGYSIADALEEIADSNEYFQWSVGEYLSYYRTSKNLGEAMKKSGFTLPDDDIADLLEVLSSFGKFEERLIILAEDMVEGFVKKSEGIAKVVSVLTLILAGVILGGLMFGMYTTVMDMMKAIKVF